MSDQPSLCGVPGHTLGENGLPCERCQKHCILETPREREAAGVLIGLTGRLGVGKSTLADILAELIPGARVVAFADALKRDVHHMVEGASGVELYDDTVAALKGDCFGPIYQGYGELCRRMLSPDHWVRRLEATLPPRAVVADVRHLNEAAWIKSRSGVLIAISGPCRRAGDQRSTEHPSERHVEEIAAGADWWIENAGDVAALRAQADRFVDHLAGHIGSVAWMGVTP